MSSEYWITFLIKFLFFFWFGIWQVFRHTSKGVWIWVRIPLSTHVIFNSIIFLASVLYQPVIQTSGRTECIYDNGSSVGKAHNECFIAVRAPQLNNAHREQLLLYSTNIHKNKSTLFPSLILIMKITEMEHCRCLGEPNSPLQQEYLHHFGSARQPLLRQDKDQLFPVLKITLTALQPKIIFHGMPFSSWDVNFQAWLRSSVLTVILWKQQASVSLTRLEQSVMGRTDLCLLCPLSCKWNQQERCPMAESALCAQSIHHPVFPTPWLDEEKLWKHRASRHYLNYASHIFK